MALLSKEELLKNGKTLPTKVIEVPEWGGEVTIRCLTGAERDRYEASLARLDRKTGAMVPNLVNSRARLVAMSIVDETGKRMFSDDDILELGGTSSIALTRVWVAACQLSGISEAEVEAAAEDFDEIQSEDSSEG
ncbi:hypothetical protein BJP40_06720 [Streptomyces sp. CC53]|uniref:hypothetical protein n=1 Tax=Streptomyces sp. CC53 TaxID=1906740 RepID=UPI0008DD6786|nr:hypothetical protein [Streptomyces sp. CC53]OII61214.1 hypothetical protein BJP40_06720 [Streptomyces sp. CC53]